MFFVPKQTFRLPSTFLSLLLLVEVYTPSHPHPPATVSFLLSKAKIHGRIVVQGCKFSDNSSFFCKLTSYKKNFKIY